jgi:hypothetical protein
LLERAGTDGGAAVGRSLAPLREYLGRRAAPVERRRLLCHPLLIEGLHALAPLSPELRRWHDAVTAAPASGPAGLPAESAAASLGNVTLVLRLRDNPDWEGEHDLCTDVLGRLEFPFCDWSVALRTDEGECLGTRTVKLTLDHDRASWRLGDATSPFLVMSRDDCLRMLVDHDDPHDRRQLAFPDAHLRPCLQCAHAMRHAHIRYDPVAFQDFQAHAGITGGLVGRILTAIKINSPAVYREIGTFLHTVRGFEFPPRPDGAVASFSDPTAPGVMGFAVSYTPRHEPCLDPFCFTWFGHEMGHTKDYLCDTVLYGCGSPLLRNAAEWTAPIPRYGRPLTLRTVIQVPYVHLYEWALLMDFWEGGFHGLPWNVPADVVAVGEDLAAEITEAFALIDSHAQLTPVGVAAVTHFRELFAQAQARWRALRLRGHARCS